MKVQSSAPETSVSPGSEVAVGPPSSSHLGKLLLGDGAGSHPAAVHPRPGPAGRPAAGTPGLLSPGIRHRLNAEARLARHRRAPEATFPLPAAGLQVSHRQGLRLRLWLLADLREARRCGRREARTPKPSFFYETSCSPPTWTPRTLSSFRHCLFTATPATTACQAWSWAPGVPCRALTRIHSTLMEFTCESHMQKLSLEKALQLRTWDSGVRLPGSIVHFHCMWSCNLRQIS